MWRVISALVWVRNCVQRSLDECAMFGFHSCHRLCWAQKWACLLTAGVTAYGASARPLSNSCLFAPLKDSIAKHPLKRTALNTQQDAISASETILHPQQNRFFETSSTPTKPPAKHEKHFPLRQQKRSSAMFQSPKKSKPYCTKKNEQNHFPTPPRVKKTWKKKNTSPKEAKNM